MSITKLGTSLQPPPEDTETIRTTEPMAPTDWNDREHTVALKNVLFDGVDRVGPHQSRARHAAAVPGHQHCEHPLAHAGPRVRRELSAYSVGCFVVPAG